MSETTNHKACLICGAVVPASTMTCPNDGEASWSATAPSAEPTPAEPPPALKKKATK